MTAGKVVTPQPDCMPAVRAPRSVSFRTDSRTNVRSLGARMMVLVLLAGCGGSVAASQTPPPVSAITSVSAEASAPLASSTAAAEARLFGPVGVASDAAGDIYVSQCGGPTVISRVDRLGQMTTIAGNGSFDFAGDDGPAILAAVGCPVGMAIGPDGALYYADHASNRIRKIDLAGIITTVAGSGPAGVNLGSFSGDGGLAVNATLQEPWDVAFDQLGSLFISDRDNNRIRKVDPTGVISTVAGDGVLGYGGDGGPAIRAGLSQPLGIALDTAGNLLIADSGNERVRLVDSNGMISTVVGTGAKGFSGDGGPATAASIDQPDSVAFDSNGVLFVSTGGRVRRIDSGTGAISTVVGSGGLGQPEDGMMATQAPFGLIYGLAFDPEGDLFLANGYDSVYRVDAKGILTLFAGVRPK